MSDTPNSEKTPVTPPEEATPSDETADPAVPDEQSKRWDIVEKLAAIATIVIAIVAVAGFYKSIESSREVSVALEQAGHAFRTFTRPILKLDSLDFTPKGRRISCEQPPQGFLLHIRNVSNVPLLKETSTLEISYDGREIPFKQDGPGNVLVSPGGDTPFIVNAENTFEKIIQNQNTFPQASQNDLPPVQFTYMAIFSDLSGANRQRYETKRSLYLDCKNFGSSTFHLEYEQYQKEDDK